MKKLLLIDSHNFIYKTLHASQKGGMDKDFHFWKHSFLMSIFYAIRHFKPDRVFFCMDDKQSWRKDIYPEYKAHRKKIRSKDGIDYDKFWPIMEQFLQDIKNTFVNMYFIKIDKVEGDDIISTICKHFNFDHKIILSTDGDYKQLLCDNVELYNHQTKKYVTCINPETELLLKIIQGDKSDNITAIQPQTGPKTALKIFDELHIYLEDKEIKEKYIRNKELIDMSMIPELYQKKIINEIENYNIQKYNALKVISFLSKNRLPKILEMLTKNNFLSKLS